jgi:hypothetical protein
MVDRTSWKEKDSDPFQFQKAGLRDGVLELIVRYSGGCEGHDFDLWAAPYTEKSDPPRRELFLVHDANGDACRSVILDTLRYELDPIPKPVVLSIRDHQGEFRYGTE